MTDPLADVLTPEQRRLNMSRIQGTDTKPEILLRRALHRCGLRYRLYSRDLPGRPDLVFPRYRAVVFVHGCFWHGHCCPAFRWPKGNSMFWQRKIKRNIERDWQTRQNLLAQGWRVMTVWECAFRGRRRMSADVVASAVADWLEHGAAVGGIEGTATQAD